MFTSMDSDDNGSYDNNLDCSWIIQAEEGQSAKLHILTMDIQEHILCLRDYLLVSNILVYGNIYYTSVIILQCIFSDPLARFRMFQK